MQLGGQAGGAAVMQVGWGGGASRVSDQGAGRGVYKGAGKADRGPGEKGKEARPLGGNR